MPHDRLNTNNNGRPLKPPLHTARTAKTPLTPRLAPSITSTSSSKSAGTVRRNVTSTPRTSTTSQEDMSTPVKSFLSNNVTPRSSSRKSRVGTSSTNSTPNATPSGTPNSSCPASTVDYPQRDHGPSYPGLGIAGFNSAQSASRPRGLAGGNNHNTTTPAPRPSLANVYNHPASDGGGTRDATSMFFHASDVRPQETAPPPKKAPVFFYANGRQDESSHSRQVPSPPLSSVGRSQPESKFFHVDSISEARGSPPILTPPPISASPEPWPTANSTQRPPSLRPPSPSKENIHISYRKGASQVIRPNLHSRPSAISIVSRSRTPDANHDGSRRRSSAASSAVRLGHSKSASLSSIDSTASFKKGMSNDLPPIVSSPLHNENRIVSNGSIPESVASAPSFPTETLSGLPSPCPQSPATTPGGPSVLERMNELAANARRERKVLDLEISNSSLLAINRSLEKEVRKQKAEIRRFRRLSRAGRFSMDAVASNLEDFSEIRVSDIGHLSDMSEEEKELDDEDPEYSSESSFDESTMSPNALAERDAVHCIKDEKRLQLDLSKHRDLLIDSQKMNQSLKRCLNWTEELIKDAQKALDYQVRPGDVTIGGRVLSSEDHPESQQDGKSRTLLSPWTPTYRATDPLESVSLPGSDRTDRDSGVDLDGLNAIPAQLLGYISPLGSPLSETPSRPPRLSKGMEEIY